MFLLPTLGMAQTTLTEGKLFYDISYPNLSPVMRRNEHMLPHDASLYFKNNLTRLEMGIGGMGKNSTIYNRETKVTTILLNIKGRKFALVQTDSQMTEVKKQMNPDTITYKFSVLLKDEYKTIAERKCRKALVYKVAGKDTLINECWFTNELPPYNTENDPNFKLIDGFLMQYTIQENGMTMVMKVKMVLPVPIENSLFEIPSTYQKVNEEELNRLLMVIQGGDSGY